MNTTDNVNEAPSESQLRNVRRAILGTNTDDSDRIVAETREGYFIPRTRAEATAYVDEFTLEAEVRNNATAKEMARLAAKLKRIWPSSANPTTATATDNAFEEDEESKRNWPRFPLLPSA